MAALRPEADLKAGAAVAPCQLLVRSAARTLTVDGLCATDSVAAILTALEHKMRVPRTHAWLSYAGKVLDPDRSLASYGLSAGSTVHHAARGRGGGSNKDKAPQPAASDAASSSGAAQVRLLQFP